MTTVRGVFYDEAQLTRAVEGLVGRSVPVDEIRVVLLDTAGAPRRELAVEDEMGALRGALLGGTTGAALGLVAAVIAVGVYAGWPELFTPLGFSWLVRGALLGMVGGVPLGGLLGMGRWRRNDHLDPAELARRGAQVEVESDEMAAVAQEVMEQAGADHLSVLPG